MDDCVFCGIVAGRLPSTTVHETDSVLAFRDIAPNAPVDVLVIPKAHHPDLAALVAADPGLAARMLSVVAEVARAEGLAGGGYRTVFNTGRHAGQEVRHAHAHVLGGAPLGPMAAA
jgi:histidine triad (HIT) family protein